jgi:type IV pilus assembly protein PilV
MTLIRSQFFGDADWVPASPIASQGGATLLEALITLLVMSIGLLGVAALQMVGTQENASALRQSQAIWFAYDMADRMRANLDYGPPPPGRNTPDKWGDHYKGIDVSAGTTATGQSCGAGNSCNRDQMRDFDKDQWRAQVMTLPGGQGTVVEDAAVGGRYLVRVLWDDDTPNVDASRASKGCPSDSSITKTCVEITVQP